MKKRPFVPALLVLLCAAACDSPDDTSPDAGNAVEAGADVRDVALPDADAEGNADSGGNADAIDVASPDANDATKGTSDARDGSSDASDGDRAQPDGEGGEVDGDSGPLDGDAGLSDSDGPPLSCDSTHERLALTVTVPGGGIQRCADLVIDGGPATVHQLLSGVVRASSSDAGSSSSSVTIDTCVGDGCAAQLFVIRVDTPTPFTIPVGAYVEAEYWMAMSHECTQLLRISNLAEWNGQTNPVSTVNKTYLVASDGSSDPNAKMVTTGIGVSPKRLDCPADDASCGTPMPVGAYAFEFSASGSASLTVTMGQSLAWTGNGQNFVVRNHRSYQSGLCDDDWNWAFSIVGQ
ncbi:MAG TPA: hypothetical protein VK550_28820 [Polyangiaceae bacterium]|nr:hypothetical protein [Polyangiaceae bacterium]